jgi:hypothetical protein
MAIHQRSPQEFWQGLQFTEKDIQILANHLFETEDPQTLDALVGVLVRTHLEKRKRALEKDKAERGKQYLPSDTFTVGDAIVLPQLDWQAAVVVAVREGVNPALPPFKVITVNTEDGKILELAAELPDHPLNSSHSTEDDGSEDTPESVLAAYGPMLRSKLRKALEAQSDLVRIGYTWFPKSLLVDISLGHLNLIEAILETQDGGPIGTPELLEQLELEYSDSQRLMEFSLNYALQEDSRFEEVGSTGVFSWFLKRLEPKYVLETPLWLHLETNPADTEALSPEDINVLQDIDDEHTFDIDFETQAPDTTTVSLALNYPHWRAGSLPITPASSAVIPSALESEHIQLTLKDAQTDEEISAWVVRSKRYVIGLRDWYLAKGLIPGSIIEISTTSEPGVVSIDIEKKNTNREWLKTLLVGADGGVVLALLRQTINAGFDERMAIAIPDPVALDNLWEERKNRNIQLRTDVNRMVAELSKLNNQNHVHFIDLYAAVNLIRRTAPQDILAVLKQNKDIVHVGDNYYHFKESA